MNLTKKYKFQSSANDLVGEKWTFLRPEYHYALLREGVFFYPCALTVYQGFGCRRSI
jgi:hypothetical protein